MGAFPSHDAPELIYSTLVTQPTTESKVEVCLVPLLPRFFNDAHKKVKKKLNDLLARKGGVSPPAPTPTGPLNSPPPKRADASGSSAIVDYIIAGTEAFFFMKTEDAVTSETEGAAAVGATESASRPATQHAAPPFIRPVPFAVCLLEPDADGAGGKPHTPHPHGNSNPNLVMIKGRRVQLVGFISCCMDRHVHLLHITPGGKNHLVNGSVGASTADGKKSVPVVLDVIFDDNATHGYLMESVVLLASLAFRKQFVNCCALYFPAGDKGVEAAFDRYMERLQLRLALRHNDYRGLRMFYTHFQLLDMIKEFRPVDGGRTHFTLFENHHGEYGLEATFPPTFLSRWMRYVEGMMRVDSVHGHHVRCNAIDLLLERDRLVQERQDSGAFLEEEEEDECLFGGTLLARALKRWLCAASQQAAPSHVGAPFPSPMVFIPSGGFWPTQMPMVMGGPPGWPGGVLPAYGAALPATGILPQPPPFVGGAQMFPGGPTYMAPQGILTQPAAFPPPPSAAPQQIVYILPQGGQIAQAVPQPPAQVFYAPKQPAFPAFHPYATFQPPPQ